MDQRIVPINTINKTEYIYIQRNDVYNNQPLTGLSYNTANLKAYYHNRKTASVSITLASQTANGPWVSGGFVELDSVNLPGYYRFDVPNELYSTAYLSDVVTLALSGAANMYPVVIGYQLEPSITISALGIYNKVLTANEVALNYASTRGRFSAPRSYVSLGTIGNPATSGYEIALTQPAYPSGYYYIKSATMTSSLYMYVDMTNEGGGYDYYPITNGITVAYKTEYNSGTALGLDLVYPRSKLHWKSIYEYTQNVLGTSWNTYMKTTGAIFNTIAGNYTSVPMRDPRYYDTGATGWAVPDGGRWFIRDTAYNEPNGNYTPNGFLVLQNLQSDGSILAFDDGGASYTGNSYLISTNAKP